MYASCINLLFFCPAPVLFFCPAPYICSDMLPYFSHLRPYICSVLLRVPFLSCSRTCFPSDLHPYLVMLPVPFFCHAAVPALLALPMHGGSRWQLGRNCREDFWEETDEKSSGKGPFKRGLKVEGRPNNMCYMGKHNHRPNPPPLVFQGLSIRPRRHEGSRSYPQQAVENSGVHGLDVGG